VRVCIPIAFRPEGGGFYFLRALAEHLGRAGWGVTAELRDRYDLLFTNHWLVPAADVLRAIRRNPDVRVVQRVDGAARDYGREDDADERQARVNRLADLTIFQSRYCRTSTRETFRVIARDGPVIHNPVDVELFAPEGERQEFPEPVRVACTSWSTNPRKGAAEVYAAARGHPALGFVLCGNYPDAPDLPNLHRLGVLGRPELARALRSCQALLTFSRNEACPNHVLEGLASGLPVLYAESGATPELVGDCGLPVSLEGFGEALGRLLARREELSLRARERALALFHPERIFARYRDVLEQALARPTAVPRAARLRRAWADLPRAWLSGLGGPLRA
jgi:glycosyltransferase involved in cell wall biosynthesis